MIPMHDERWRIALTEPNRERLAVDGLLRIGIPSYWPKILKPYRAGNGANCTREASMFPGYLFVKFSLDLPKWGRIFQTPGIRTSKALMRRSFGEEGYKEISEAQVAAIVATERRIMGEKNFQSKARGLKIGDEVSIRVGKKFAEVLAKIETLDDDERIGVMYLLFGKEHREIVPLDRLAV